MNPSGASLLPKLRDEFAEFLNECSLERLWILSSSTCVGLRYGLRQLSLAAFLGGVASRTLWAYALVRALTVWDARPDLPSRTRLRRINGTSIRRLRQPSASPHRNNELLQVREY